MSTQLFWHLLAIGELCFAPSVAKAAIDSDDTEGIDYSLSTQMSASVGRHTPLWLNANKYGLSSLSEGLCVDNDTIETVDMTDVIYLPDKAFDNCGKLALVDLGGAMQDVGVLPFYDCTNLVSVACGNGTYVANNGILYENLSDGSKKIIECFASRGGAVGSSTVDTDADPDLANVREIANNAFDDCDQIRFVDFTDADNISTIPEGCFRNCDNLRTVELPTTVSSVEKDAFTNMESDVEIVARNKTLFLSSGAIDNK